MKLTEVKWPQIIGYKTRIIKKSLEQHRIGRIENNLDLIVSMRVLRIQTKYLETLNIPEYNQMNFEFKLIKEVYDSINDYKLLLQNSVFKNKLENLINEQKDYIKRL